MKGICLASAMLAPWIVAFSACDDATPGARANCAQGGELTDCPDTERTAWDVCWRLVDCGAVAIEGEEEFSYDWGICMDDLETLPGDRQRLVIDCIAASTCDQLRVDGSPEDPRRDQMYCVSLGRDF